MALALDAATVGCGGADGDAGPGGAAAWESLSPAPLARTEVAAARLGRFVYVIGGFERESGATTAATERYDIRRDRWSLLPSAPTARGALVAGGRFYALAGRAAGTGNYRVAEAFDPRSRRWRRLPDLARPRHGLGVVARRGRVYALQGGDSPGFAFTSAVETLSVLP